MPTILSISVVIVCFALSSILVMSAVALFFTLLQDIRDYYKEKK